MRDRTWLRQAARSDLTNPRQDLTIPDRDLNNSGPGYRQAPDRDLTIPGQDLTIPGPDMLPEHVIPSDIMAI